ncbi:MAG: bifunctional phosphoribosyl-AMP cyclohydrolase/phosphoribosyl-ATP diphosphatase HisIE [Bacteroidota bacterium]
MTPKLNYDSNGLIPVVIQNAQNQQVLMLGYMNETSFQQTITTKVVTFYSRSRQEIWVKGATSGNYLNLVSWSVDCDKDALLITAIPAGPTCHTGAVSCFGEQPLSGLAVISQLEQTIQDRFANPKEGSYIQSLIEKGLPKMAQKVGEEGVEVVIEAMRDEPHLFLEESADLLFHYMILLRAKGVDLSEVLEVLKGRMG